MAKRKIPSLKSVDYYKKHLIPSTVGGVAAYVLSGALAVGLVVFVAVWVGNMISHHLSKK